MLGLFAKSFLVDGVIESLNQCKSFLIITDNPEPAVSYIINTMGHSATTFEGVGEYAHTRRRIIITLCRRFEAPALKRKMREIDPHAFIIVTTTSEIVGHGFGGE